MPCASPPDAAVSSNSGAGRSSSSPSSPSAGTCTQALSPSAHSWTVGKTSVSPAASGSLSDSTNASR
ncbi:Uncharacterised protein [Mycobacteroides abscessus]|nr:Uncharacterised protein [Mycobacteroides abscessus]